MKTKAILNEVHIKMRFISHELLPSLLAKIWAIHALQSYVIKIPIKYSFSI
jgi:hypothetical protein